MSNQSDTLKMQVLTLVLFMWKNCKFSELGSNHSEDLNEKMHLINGEEQMAHIITCEYRIPLGTCSKFPILNSRNKWLAFF